MNTFNLYDEELANKITEEGINQIELLNDRLSKTNSLGSHYPEHTTYPANKMFPKEESLRLKEYPIARKLYKKTHSKRSRRYNKNINNFI